MKVLDISQAPAPPTFEDGAEGRSGETRERVSVSTIKSYLSTKFGMNKYPDTDFNSPGMKLKSWLGAAFEARFSRDLDRLEPDHQSFPGEILSPSGGVMSHPDGLYGPCGGLAIGEIGVDEFKHTYSSARHYDAEKALLDQSSGLCWDYLFQLKSYIAILLAAGYDCFEGRLWILAAMGDWRERRDPELHCARVLFEERELTDQLHILETDRFAAYDWKYKAGK